MNASQSHRSRLLIFWLLALLALAPLANAVAADVWVNTNSGVYHCPHTRYYGNTKHGKHMSESAAATHGYRAAYGKPCSPDEIGRVQSGIIQSLAPTQSGQATRVWINTGSHVYHCPGTRYYGATKRGRYASEAEAVSGGNRPAYGQRCH